MSLEAVLGGLDDTGREAVRAVLDVHGEGLGRLVAALDRAQVEGLVRDPRIGALLALHGLHPHDLATRAREAIERIAARLERYGAKARLGSVEDGVVTVRVTVSGNEAPVARFRAWIDDALCETTPDAARVEVQIDDPSLVPASRLVRAKPTHEGAEMCDLCGAALASEHEHLIDPQTRGISCACGPCATLFAGAGGPTRKKRVLPRRERLDVHLSAESWDALAVPVGLAFFWQSSALGRVVAMYPGPTGATESLLPVESWEAVVAKEKLPHLEPDVEAILMNRTRGAADVWRVSIDRCFALTGTLRATWRGLSGGDAVWSAIEQHFPRDGSHA